MELFNTSPIILCHIILNLGRVISICKVGYVCTHQVQYISYKVSIFTLDVCQVFFKTLIQFTAGKILQSVDRVYVLGVYFHGNIYNLELFWCTLWTMNINCREASGIYFLLFNMFIVCIQAIQLYRQEVNFTWLRTLLKTILLLYSQYRK
jgi:hypothetical protein